VHCTCPFTEDEEEDDAKKEEKSTTTDDAKKKVGSAMELRQCLFHVVNQNR